MKRVSKNGPGAITPALSKRISALSAEGKGDSEIARIIGKVSKQAVRAHRLRRAPQPATLPEVVAASTKLPIPPVKAEDEIVGALEPVPEAAGLVDIVARLRMTRGILDRMADGVEEGHVNGALWVQLGKFEADLAERVIALTPPTPPDPARDPANIDARKEFEGRMKKMIGAAEKAEGAT